MFDPSLANILTKTVSLTNGTPSNANVITGKAGMRFLITSVVISSNDTTLNPLVTIDDNTANVCCAVYSNLSPATPFFGVPYKAGLGANIRVAAPAITAAKTCEISLSGFFVPS